MASKSLASNFNGIDSEEVRSWGGVAAEQTVPDSKNVAEDQNLQEEQEREPKGKERAITPNADDDKSMEPEDRQPNGDNFRMKLNCLPIDALEVDDDYKHTMVSAWVRGQEEAVEVDTRMCPSFTTMREPVDTHDQQETSELESMMVKEALRAVRNRRKHQFPSSRQGSSTADGPPTSAEVGHRIHRSLRCRKPKDIRMRKREGRAEISAPKVPLPPASTSKLSIVPPGPQLYIPQASSSATNDASQLSDEKKQAALQSLNIHPPMTFDSVVFNMFTGLKSEDDEDTAMPPAQPSTPTTGSKRARVNSVDIARVGIRDGSTSPMAVDASNSREASPPRLRSPPLPTSPPPLRYKRSRIMYNGPLGQGR